MASADGIDLNEGLSVVNFWDRRGLDALAFRGYDDRDISYLTNKMAYLQLVCLKDERYQPNPEDALDNGTSGSPALLTTRAGWVMQYWPPLPELAAAISSSPGSQLLNYEDLGHPEEFEMSFVTGHPSKQAFLTAGDMVALAIQQGWLGVHIVAGERHMQWAAWALAESNGLDVKGFDPSADEKLRAERCGSILDLKHLIAEHAHGNSLGLGQQVRQHLDGAVTDVQGRELDFEESAGSSNPPMEAELTDEALFGSAAAGQQPEKAEGAQDTSE